MLAGNAPRLANDLGQGSYFGARTPEDGRIDWSWPAALVYNLIRIVMLRAARSQGVNVNRLSFADTLAWVRHGDISTCPLLIVNPLRPGRLEPRVLKRQKKEFPYMTQPRSELKAQLRARHCDTA